MPRSQQLCDAPGPPSLQYPLVAICPLDVWLSRRDNLRPFAHPEVAGEHVLVQSDRLPFGFNGGVGGAGGGAGGG